MNYNFKDYKNGVLSFASNTKEWDKLDEYKFYTACNSYDEWEETSDNANGGLDVSWAFHQENITDVEILEHFYNEIINILNTNIENEAEIKSIELNY